MKTDNTPLMKYDDFRKTTSSDVVLNKTPHDVHIVDDDNNVIRVYKRESGSIRISVDTERIGTLSDGTPIVKSTFGVTQDLPDFIEGTYYIVSQLVKDANPDRTDLLVPAEVVRDDKGQIIGSKSLSV